MLKGVNENMNIMKVERQDLKKEPNGTSRTEKCNI